MAPVSRSGLNIETGHLFMVDSEVETFEFEDTA